MFIVGKILGALFGALIAGPFGLFIGILVGHYFDRGLARQWSHYAPFLGQHRRAVQSGFFSATFLVMGHLAKSDGRISESEIEAANSVMTKMGLTPDQRRDAIRYFNEGKEAHFAMDPVLRQLHHNCRGNHQLLELFFNIQLQAAYADGQLTQNEQRILQHIITVLGLHPVNNHRFEEPYYSYQRSQQYDSQSSQQQTYQTRRSSLADAYAVLEIPVTASDHDVKRAYRRQMNKNHPDKLVSQGLPEAMIKVANEKTQAIKTAYEQIKAARGK